jgi:hypothetical protein
MLLVGPKRASCDSKAYILVYIFLNLPYDHVNAEHSLRLTLKEIYSL